MTVVGLSFTFPAAARAEDEVQPPNAAHFDWDHTPDHVVGPAIPFASGDAPHTIYINFDGVTLTEGWPDNARDNQTSLTEMVGTYAPFGAPAGDPVRSMILDEVREDYAGMWIEVTDERPSVDHYTMIVVSPTNAKPGLNGIASLNCGGSPLGIGFAFFSQGSGSVDTIATTISHEAGHTFGIEHVQDNGDIMFPSSGTTAPLFLDQCAPLAETAACGEVHEGYCPAGQENTYRELVDLFGMPVDPDGAAPSVTLVAPVDRERFELDEDIVFIAEASDDVSVSQVKLLINGELAGTKLTGPYEWAKDPLDEGIYEIAVVARDGGGNETTSESVTIAVGDAVLPDPPTSQDDADADGNGSDPTDEPTTSAGDPLGLDDADADAEGCACTSEPGRPTSLPLWLLLAAITTRRVRRGRTPSTRAA